MKPDLPALQVMHDQQEFVDRLMTTRGANLMINDWIVKPALLGLSAMLVSAVSGPASAEPDVAMGKTVCQEANCVGCRKWHGGGSGGAALSLRQTELDWDLLIEVIKCGRPATRMPFHARGRRARQIGLDLRVRIVVQRSSGLGIEAAGSCQILDEYRAPDERAGRPVERITKAVAIGMQGDLFVHAVDRRVHQDVLGDAVMVVRIVGLVLEMPLDLAGIGIDAKHAVGAAEPFAIEVYAM